MTELPPFELGFARTELCRRLVDAVLRGKKIATVSPAPGPGCRFVLLGYDDEALGIVEATDMSVVRTAEVDLQFVRDEGEGFVTVAQWREVHEQFWVDSQISDDTEVVCLRFRLVAQNDNP